MNPDKIIFFDKAVKSHKEICCFHFNDVWCDFADMFHRKDNGKFNKHTTISVDFTKYMQHAAYKHGVNIEKSPVDRFDRNEFGVRVIWRLTELKEQNK